MDKEIVKYYKILSSSFPEFLYDYINTKEMKRIRYISMNCGSNYSALYNIKKDYSNYDHSIGVALIIWNFTHDKKQTLAGLFHDIATPTFKHCIDFMNGDHEKQESTEERTYSIIKNSKEIMDLLKRDNIAIEEVCDYKLYPIADNSSPSLSADRLEYNFSGGLYSHNLLTLNDIERIYNDILVLKNENNIDEIGFTNKEVCDYFISKVCELWPKWCDDNNRTVMQFVADICLSLKNLGYLSVDDLYTLKEEEVINIIRSCNNTDIREAFENFTKCKVVNASRNEVKDKYSINVKTKSRYLNPLVNDKRIMDISEDSNQKIKKYIKMPKGGYYTSFDFNFKPVKDK